MSSPLGLMRTVVTVEVLHVGPIEWDNIADLHEMGTSGDVSLRYDSGDTERLLKNEFIDACTTCTTSSSPAICRPLQQHSERPFRRPSRISCRAKVLPCGHYQFTWQPEEDLAYSIELSLLAQYCGLWSDGVVDCAHHMDIERDVLPRVVAAGDLLRELIEGALLERKNRRRMIKLTEKEAKRANSDGIVIITRWWKSKQIVKLFPSGTGMPKYRVSAVKVLAEKRADGATMAQELEGPMWANYVSEKSGVGAAAADLLRWLHKLGWNVTSYTDASRHRVGRKQAAQRAAEKEANAAVD